MRFGRRIPGAEASQLSWAAVGASLGFWWSVCLALLTHLVWPEMLPPPVKWVWLVTAASCWLAVQAMPSHGGTSCKARDDDSRDSAGEVYPEFLSHYLRGEWDLLVPKLNRYLRRNSADVDARLLLALTLRRQKNLTEAKRQLEFVRQLDTSGKWVLELHREKQLLRQLETQSEPEAREESPRDGQEPSPV